MQRCHERDTMESELLAQIDRPIGSTNAFIPVDLGRVIFRVFI
jgi:hypothetical protein